MNSPTPPTRNIHLFDEVRPLKEVLVWGEPGCETLLGQLLPKAKSLFHTYYEVPQARQEFRHMQALLEGAGAQVVRVKDVYVELLKGEDMPGLPATLRELEKQLLAKADRLYETYFQEDQADLQAEGLSLSPAQVFAQVRTDIHKVLQEDADLYGEPATIRLNYALSLSREMPISDIFYGRDQSNAIGDRIVLSAMRWEIRKPEVEIYEKALRFMGYGDDTLVHVEQGTIEGGDSMVFDNTCYIGVGARTSLAAVTDLYEKIGDKLEEQGIRMTAIVNQKHADEGPQEKNPAGDHMRVMHLDMFWNPLDERSVVAFGEEIDRRRALEFSRVDGQASYRDMGSFREYLLAHGLEIVEVSAEEQINFGANLVNLGNRKIMVPLSRNRRVLAELERRGFTILQAEISKLVGGYGAVHCLTAPIRRD